MQCPVCENQQLAISSREGVEIDYCPQCRGVWLDRGELDKIIDRAGPASCPPRAATPAAPRRSATTTAAATTTDGDDDPRYGKKKKRRGGFLEDLFDFG